MSGIAGIFNLDGQPVEPALLQRMSNALAHRGPDGEGRWIEGAVGLSCQLMRVTPESLTETQPVIHTSGAVIVFDGRLDNREELLEKLGSRARISSVAPDPDLVLAAYEAFGERFPEHLNGDFALGLYQPRERRLIVVRDSIGVRPLYYCRAGNTFLFASEIKAILEHPRVVRRPNDEMLSAFLVGDGTQRSYGETFFEGVSSLVPGHMAIVTKTHFVTQCYWDFDPSHKVHFKSVPEYAEAFRSYFEQAVRRRLRSAYPVAVAVSGGLDSSSILCVAQSLKNRDGHRSPSLLPISYTFPPGSPSDEKSFLVDIERALDIEIERVPRESFVMLKGARDALRKMEAPFLRGPQNPNLKFYDVIHRHGARVLLTGTWGDQMLANQEYLVDLFGKLEWRKTWRQLNEYAGWFSDMELSYFRRVFAGQLVRHYVPDSLRPLLKMLRRRIIGTAPTHLLYSDQLRKRAHQATSRNFLGSKPFSTSYSKYIYQWARSWYYVQCMEWGNKTASTNGLEMAYPFLDRDLISFVLGIPGEIHTWKGVHKSLLREASRGILPESIRQRRWKADATGLLNEMMETEYPSLIQCLQSGGMAVSLGYVKEDVMMRELTRLKDLINDPKGNEVTWSLGNLLGLELWLQVFFKDTTLTN